MRIGLVTKWFNRGQAFVSRYIRDALDARGHETFVLARPTRDKGPMAAHVDRTGVWDQPGVTEASDWEVPYEEYERWIADNGIEAVHWDNCYQHEEIAQIRESGTKTVGRFVWEMFGAGDAEPAKRAYDVLYSLTRCEQQRYGEMGIDSPYLRWGLHPELLEAADNAQAAGPHPRTRSGGDAGVVSFYFPGALLGPRKPHKEVIEAFTNAKGDNLRLIFKAQLERRMNFLEKAAAADPRIELVIDDMPTDEHLQLFASCDVCLGPSRWEGLGLFLYEAIAFGITDAHRRIEYLFSDFNHAIEQGTATCQHDAARQLTIPTGIADFIGHMHQNFFGARLQNVAENLPRKLSRRAAAYRRHLYHLASLRIT